MKQFYISPAKIRNTRARGAKDAVARLARSVEREGFHHLLRAQGVGACPVRNLRPVASERQRGGAVRRSFAVSALLLLAACSPMTVAEAERQCLERARLAAQPRGEVVVGAGTEGPFAGVAVRVSSDYITGRDPSAVFDSCVMTKAGQAPSRPLYQMPGWEG